MTAETSETEAEFLARLRPPYIKRADRARILTMMADAAREAGDLTLPD